MADMTFTPKQVREGLVHAAEATWKRGIRDTQDDYPGDIEAITEMWLACEWDWWLELHGEKVVDEDGEERFVYCERYVDEDGVLRFNEWCGIGIGYLTSIVGDYVVTGMCVNAGFKLGVRKYMLPGTGRLANPGKWTKHRLPVPELVASQDILKGDVFTVGERKTGNHIVLARDRPDNAGNIPTFEFNATGLMPDHVGPRRAEGVVKRVRRVAEVKRVYRLGAGHMLGDIAE